MTLFIILLWIVATVPFLLKNRKIRELTETVCKQNVFTKVVAVCLLVVAIIHGSTKPFPVETLHATSLQLPQWYLATGLPTTASDGRIPDFWKFVTITEDCEDDADPDNDVLENFAEFIAGTDPLTRDTDGDGFADGEETNPLVHEDFTVDEPDENNNGVADYLDGLGLYVFTPDVQGFDASYAVYDMPADTTNTFDVAVTVESMRSVVLTWTGFDGGIVLPVAESPTGQTMATQTVRVRLPFGETSRINVSPYFGDVVPEGFPQGPWKARMRTDFVSSRGVSASGDYASNGAVATKRVMIAESVIVHDFPTGGASLLRSAGASVSPALSGEFQPQEYEVLPAGKYWHEPDDTETFFIDIKHGAKPPLIEWRTEFKGHINAHVWEGAETNFTLMAKNAGHVFLPLDEDIYVMATLVFADNVKIELCTTWHYCPTLPVDFKGGTTSFCPNVGETTGFSIRGEGCRHQYRERYFEAEVFRGTLDDRQHVTWLDTDPSTETFDRRTELKSVNYHTVVWDGIATEGVAEFTSETEFTQGSKPFNRVFPAVASGDPVPPPFYYVCARVLEKNEDGTYTVVEEYITQVFVPQLVYVVWTDEDIEALRKPVIADDGTVLFAGVSAKDMETEMKKLPGKMESMFPMLVNIRVVGSNGNDENIKGPYKLVAFTTLPSHENSRRRGANHSGYSNFPNRNAGGYNLLYAPSFQETMKEQYKAMNLYGTFPVPLSADMFISHIAYTAVHEVGHSLGLVSDAYLFGKDAHNRKTSVNHMMDSGGIMKMFERVQISVHYHHWNTLNSSYLMFILPIF